MDTPAVFATPAEPVEELVRTALAGQYSVERLIGRGGMATVYLAEEAKHRRAVAIKVLHPELAASLGAERFLREIGIAARLSHPHLVPLLDSGRAGELLYYVSAYIGGGSLRDRLRASGRLEVADALRVAREVGAGLDYVHRAGFVHRDVKPENILFADELALLADLGIARSREVEHEAVTAAGLAVGTPEYMSPEQASGERDLDPRSDVYSLACVLFEMLAGEPPFAGGGGGRAVIARHLTEAPRSVRALRPEVGEGVDAAITRALSKDPAHRWASVPAFLAALQEAPPAGAGTAPAHATRSIAVLPFVNLSPDRQNEYLSDGITDELIGVLARVDGIRVASRTSVFALKGKPTDIRSVGALLGCSVVLEGTVRGGGDRIRITASLSSTDDGRLLWSQHYDRRLDDVLAVQDEIARTIVDRLRATSLIGRGPLPAARRHTPNARAFRLYLQGRYEWNRRTQAGVAAGIRYFEQAIAEDPAYALAYTGLSDCYALEVDYRSIPVHEGFAKARDFARQAIALDDTLAEAHTSLAWVRFVYDWEWEDAEREFRRAVELDPGYATAHQWYAFLHVSRGLLAEALVEVHTAVELDAGSVSARRSLAWAYYYARRYDQARLHLERAIAMNPNAEETYRVLGLVLAMEGEHDEAITVLREATGMEGAGAYTRATLGYALARSGRTAEARAILDELLALERAEYVSPAAIATVLLGLGDREAALDWIERAREERRGWLAYLRVNPIFDPVRSHPRFEALLRAMRLA